MSILSRHGSAASGAAADSEISPLSLRLICSAYFAVMVALGLLIFSAPLPILLDRFIPDDAFYYFNPARIFASTGFSSFDGIHGTNGYQPLWFLISALVFRFFPHGGEAPIRVILLVQVLFSALSVVLMLRAVGRIFTLVPTAIAFVLWVVIMQRAQLNGLETSLQMFLYALFFKQVVDLQQSRGCNLSARSYMKLGLIGGFLFLSRTDMAFVGISVLLSILLRDWRLSKANVRDALWFATPFGILASAYLTINLIQTGHIMPVSGAAKQFHSALARSAAIEATGDALRVYIGNMVWPLAGGNYRFVMVGTVAPALLLLLSWARPFKALSPLRPLWPFMFGAAASYLFYTIAFYGGFTRTLWYYGPQTFLACLSIAATARMAEAAARFRLPLGLVPLVLVGLTLDWMSPAVAVGSLSWIPVVGLVRWLFGGSESAPPTKLWAGHLASAGGSMILFAAQGVNLGTWVLATVCLTVVPSLFVGNERAHRRGEFVGVLVLVATSLVHLANLVPDIARPPGHWNYNLYLGALWAQENLPRNATIWSGSAGILGYFSDHTVVNTDGLANDYDFLEGVLKKGRLSEYVRQWDYAIDAFPDERLAESYPDGEFLVLPPHLQRFPFFDGDLWRQVRVFRMDRNSTATAPLRGEAPSWIEVELTLGESIRIKRVAVSSVGTLLVQTRMTSRSPTNYKFYLHATLRSAPSTFLKILDFDPVIPTSEMIPGVTYTTVRDLPELQPTESYTLRLGLFDETSRNYTRLLAQDGSDGVDINWPDAYVVPQTSIPSPVENHGPSAVN